MYKSTIHTPASNCSAGTGVSGGPARSVFDQMDDFDKQLKEKLEASFDVTGNLESKNAAERVAEKVAEWQRNMDSLFDGEEGAMEEEGYISGSGTGDEGDDEIWVDDDVKTKYRKNEEPIKSVDKFKELASKETSVGKEKSSEEEGQWRMILDLL
jgi:hypothetical protein